MMFVIKNNGMKIRLLAMALLVVFVGFGACKKKKNELSPECKILTFTVNGVPYQVNENAKTIYYKYPKTSAGVWTDMPTTAVSPKITYSDKATIQPLENEPQNFHIEGFTIKYRVTAEDGKSFAEYTVTVDRE